MGSVAAIAETVGATLAVVVVVLAIVYVITALNDE